MKTTWWVWALDPDNAIEMLWHCQEYKTKEEALRQLRVDTKLFKVEVTEV